jgi:hypothetical protein
LIVLMIMAALNAEAQVYSPKVLAKGQADATDLRRLAESIYAQAGAKTPRERAEAIWRFFLTDGRFVAPGFWYHIAGWAYEEPVGEALDPLKLMNSYGFGLCYQIAPVMEAVFEAGGFEDARVWFLTGHTVTEVYYDGAYHHYDSDMLGYTTVGNGPVATSRVASVRDLEKDGSIMTGKLTGPRKSDPARTPSPWYPADVQAAAIPGLAEAFTTASDNSLFPFQRSPMGHTMDFVLRPGERLIRYYQPEGKGLYYLPYKWTGTEWREFPREIAEYKIRTEDGPASQKDARRWATGKIEYRPRVSAAASAVYEARSPYVIIDAEFQMGVAPAAAQQAVKLETSSDDGLTWTVAGELAPAKQGSLRAEPAVLTRSAHGRRTAVSGTYGYLVRVTVPAGARVEDLLLSTRFQLNPRTLPELKAGRNELAFTSGPARERRELSVDTARADRIASSVKNARYVSEGGQGYWVPATAGAAEFVFRVANADGEPLTGLDAGGRFLDLVRGMAPDKFTAEVRKVAPLAARQPAASIAWSKSPDGPFQTVWEYDPKLTWKDGDPIDRTLLWPEVDRHIALPAIGEVYVRYSIRDLALDHVRLAAKTKAPAGASAVAVSHLWKEGTAEKSFAVTIPAGTTEQRYVIDIPQGAKVTDEAIVFECKRTGQ